MNILSCNKKQNIHLIVVNTALRLNYMKSRLRFKTTIIKIIIIKQLSLKFTAYKLKIIIIYLFKYIV